MIATTMPNHLSFAAAVPPGTGLSTWVVAGLLVLGGILTIGGLAGLARYAQRTRGWPAATGTITSSRLDSTGNGSIHFSVTFQVDGQPVVFRNPFSSGSGIDPIGRQVQVRYDPADPQRAVVVGGPGRPWMAMVALSAFGLLAIVFALALR